MYSLVNPVLNNAVRGLCVKPYPLHPKGCPNFGKKNGCPPAAKLLGEILDLSQPVWAIWNEFDFAAHREKMKIAHPNWSERQLSCCLYWQPRARKDLARQIDKFLSVNGPHEVVRCPEACGVDITATMHSIGHVLEWPPFTVAYQVVIAGTPRPTGQGKGDK